MSNETKPFPPRKPRHAKKVLQIQASTDIVDSLLVSVSLQ